MKESIFKLDNKRQFNFLNGLKSKFITPNIQFSYTAF